MNFQSFLSFLTYFLLLTLSLNQQLLAAIKISQASGNWSNVGVWGGAVPAAGDDIIISSGTTVHVNILFTVSMTFRNLTIEQGGLLAVGLNDVKLRIRGNIKNDGTINFWQSSTYQADIWLYGNSEWYGSGNWNLSNINIQNNSLEPADGLTLTLNGSFTAFAGSSFNKLNQYPNITIYIQGTLNTMISSLPEIYYGQLVINKTKGPVSFSPSKSSNMVSLLGHLTLLKSTDSLFIEAFNTLTLRGEVTGAGLIKGSSTSSLVVDNLNAPAINPLRILAGTQFRDFIINRKAGVTLSNGFVIRESLRLNNSCVLVLPKQILTLGINGTNPTSGSFSGDGKFIGSSNSSIYIRGKDTTSVKLNFDQSSVSNHTLNNFIVDKVAGKVGLETGDLLVSGSLNISNNNVFLLGTGTLILNVIPGFIGSACLSGSKHSGLKIAGTNLTGYPLVFDQLTPFGNSLKSYTQSRNAMITLANKLNVFEQVRMTGNSSVLVSDGNLTLLSSPDGNAGISSLLNGTDVRGDVNVQVYISGDNESMRFRGSRSLSSPLNDVLLAAGKKKSLEQLKDYVIITGPGGTAQGFDQGGSAQPYAETMSLYNERADFRERSYIPVSSITQPLTPGSGVFLYFRGMQEGTYLLNASKLNAPYSAPEPVTIVYKGIINKFDIPAVSLTNSQYLLDNFNGYNLIGNPYPSAIDWTKVTRSAGVNDEVITLKPGGGTATYLNGFSNNGGSPYIQTGQGFYVRTSVDGSTVSFKEDCKTSSYPARLLVQPLKNLMLSEHITLETSDLRKANTKVLRMNLANESDTDETTIVFKPQEVAEADYNDAMYFGGSTVNLASISTNEKKLAINFMPEVGQLEIIRLSINAATSGSYSLNFTDIPKGSTDIFLKDSLYPDQLTKIEKNLSYCFAIDKKDPATFGDKRLSLVFKQEINIVGEPIAKSNNTAVAIYPNPGNDQIFVNSKSFPEASLRVVIFDMKGAKKQVLYFPKGEEVRFNVSWLEPGVYVVKFQSGVNGKSISEASFIKH